MAIELHAIDDTLCYFDLHEMGTSLHTCAYLYHGDQNVLIETGATTSHAILLEALQTAQVTPEQLDHVILTHVHLDHAGGAGKLASVAKNARFHCHPRASRHLIDPSRLRQGAYAVYGEAMNTMYGELIPIEADRVMAHEDESWLVLPDLKLQFLHTLGHAKHHICVYDPDRKVLFSGDSVGIRYLNEVTHFGKDLIFPSASPPDFDPIQTIKTLERLQKMPIQTILHTHFGPSQASEAFESTRKETELLVSMAEFVYDETMTEATMQQALCDHLAHRVNELTGQVNPDCSKFGIDLMLNSQGLLHYMQNLHTTR